jgi:hypothetical protein
MMQRQAICFIAIFMFCAPGAGQELMAPPRAPYVAPGRMFAVEIPSGWEPVTSVKTPDLVELRVVDGSAWLQIHRLRIPESARPRQLLARAVETRLSHLSHFAELQRRDLDINGLKAASILGTFWFQGNAQYPRAFEEMYVIAGKEAFEFHFECFQPLSGALAEDVNRIYASFVARPPGTGLLPTAPADNPIDKIPF